MIELDDRVSYWRATKYGPAGMQPVEAGQYTKQWFKRYKDFSSLPTKAKEAVAVLSMNAIGEVMQGVGIRMNQFTYWLDDSPATVEIETDTSVQKER